MCVIVVQDRGFPGWETLETCWENNPHGAGLMYYDGTRKGVIIEKGFTTFSDFRRAVERVPDYKTREIVYHFRIATHGTVSAVNTHPYPLSSNHRLMHALDVMCACGIAHNGVIGQQMYSEAYRKRYDLSDSAEFIREVSQLATYTDSGRRSSKAVEMALEMASRQSGSRFAMCDSKGIRTFGSFYRYGSCLYSNQHSMLPRHRMHITGGVYHAEQD